MATTEPVALRRLCADDAAAIVAGLAEWDSVQWLSSVPFPYGIEDARSFVSQIADGLDLVITEAGRFVGMIRASEDLGYWLDPKARGRGIIDAAIRLALGRVFVAGAGEVTARVFQGNARSAAVLRRNGFRALGPGAPITRRSDGREMETLSFVISADEAATHHPFQLHTARCEIGLLSEADIAPLYEILCDPRVAPMMMAFRPGMAAADFAAMIRAASGKAAPPFRLGIRLREGGVSRLIGQIGCGPGPLHSISYALAPSVWGQGLAREFVRPFCEALAHRYGFDRIYADAFSDNPASLAVLRGAGFVETGTEMLTSAARPAPAPGVTFLWHAEG